MRIKSSFKDYYDHIAYKYGGGDPKILYMRDRLKPLVDTGYMKYDAGVYLDIPKLERSFDLLNPTRYHDLRDYTFKYLVIAGKWYLLINETFGDGVEPVFTVLSKERHPKAVEKLTNKKKFYWTNLRDFDYYVGYEDKDLIEVSRMLNTPVFIVEGYSWQVKPRKYSLHIDSKLPVLADLGIPAIYPAEQLYQDLAYFIGNKMHVSPDMAPPVEVSNKDKITQFGFDLKRSFRPKMKKAS